MSRIVLEQLGKRLGDHWAIRDLSFSVAPGEVFGLLGPNGAGKTTTLRVLAGLYNPDLGSAQIGDCRVAPDHHSNGRLRQQVGLLTEQPGFYGRLSARYNLYYFGRLHGLSRDQIHTRTRDLLARFALTDHADRPLATLSRGMKQKLAIARTVLHEPSVVFLDEPTVGLDPESTREVRQMIRELSAAGTTVLLCTHQLSEVERLCHRAAVISQSVKGVHQVASQSVRECTVEIFLSSPVSPALQTVRNLPGVRTAHERKRGLRVEVDESAIVPDVISALVQSGARVQMAAPAANPLEDVYLKLVGTNRKDSPP